MTVRSRESAFEQESALPPHLTPPTEASLQNKTNFPFNKTCLFTDFEDQTPESHFWFQEHIEPSWTTVQAEDSGESHPHQLNM